METGYTLIGDDFFLAWPSPPTWRRLVCCNLNENRNGMEVGHYASSKSCISTFLLIFIIYVYDNIIVNVSVDYHYYLIIFIINLEQMKITVSTFLSRNLIVAISVLI